MGILLYIIHLYVYNGHKHIAHGGKAMRHILAVWIEGLHHAAARTRHTDLEGPIIVAHDEHVLDASDEVLRRGVKLGASVRSALRIASALVVPYDPTLSRPLSRKAWDVMASHTPLVEVLDDHKGFVDLTGCLKPDETLPQRAEVLREQVLDTTGCALRIGGGSGRFVAQIALKKPPHGRILESEADERELIENVPLDRFPSISPELAERCARLGIRLLGDVRRFPVERVLELAGRSEGWTLHRIAHGNDTTKVQANYPPETITLSKSFLPPTHHEPQVVAVLERLSGLINEELAERQLNAIELSLELHLADGERRHQQSRFPRHQIADLARAYRAECLLRSLWRGEEVEQMTLACGKLRPRTHEAGYLWNPGKQAQQDKAQVAVEMTRARFGTHALAFAENGDIALSMPPIRFAEQIWEQNGLCPLGAGW